MQTAQTPDHTPMNKNKATRFLRRSLIALLVLTALVFVALVAFMNQQSSNTISEVGTMYMSEMSAQITSHFQTVVGLRLSQIEALVRTIPPDNQDTLKVLYEKLENNAKARDFEGLAFYKEDGSFEMLYGNPVELIDPTPFYSSVQAGEKKVAVGVDSKGNKVVLLSVSGIYPTADGGESISLVGVLPTEYISSTLSLDETEDSQTYSHIIRRDGSYVIRTGLGIGSYFDQIRATMEGSSEEEISQNLAEFRAALEADRDYSALYNARTGRRHMYCTRLPYSEWYLVIVMPYGTLDEAVSGMGVRWIGLALVCFLLLLAGLLAMFAQYYKFTGEQIRKLQTARQEAIRANKAKSEFLSNMSHDIRTPMNAIVGMTAIAMTNIDSKQQVQNCLKKITLSSKHLLGLINDILDMSKIESGKMTLNVDQASLREVMDSIVNIVQPQVRAKKQHFDVFIHDISDENVCCDSVRLNQVLINFLSNAIKFTPEGGHIEVALYEEPSPKGETFIRVHFRVKDDGIGMSPEFQKTVFDSFPREDSTRVHRTEGTGLGMAITKYIVDMMGGTIEVESEQGKGTEFRVILDFAKAEVQEEDMVLPDWRMLVVDDDQILCESTVSSLRTIGIRADWSLDAETAIKRVTEHRQKGDDYQIILLDWKLPGMDGIAAAKEIRRCVGDDLPILLISAYDWSEIEHDAREAGISGFISKPLFKSTLYYGLKRFMDDGTMEQTETDEEETNFAGRRVLVAEDNELNWEIANELLGELEMQLDWAEDGKICVEMFEKSPVGYYDAILMDLRMPVMMGYEATKLIRKMPREDANIPIIAMTANAFSEDVKRCLDCGMNAHISKPIDIKEVARMLEKWMRPRETQQ